MSILRNANLACLCRLILPLSPVEFKKWPCPMYLFERHVAVAKVHVPLSNLTNGYVALSMLGVLGHTPRPVYERRLIYSEASGTPGAMFT